MKRFLDVETVTLIVGPEKTKVILHEDVALAVSSPLDAAFTPKGFRESKTRKIEMPEEEPLVIYCFASWLYTSRLTEIAGSGRVVDLLPLMAKVYVFAEKWEIIRLKNDTIRNISRFARFTNIYHPPAEVFHIVLAGTPASSKIRMFVVDWLVWSRHAIWFGTPEFDHWLDTFPELAGAVIKAQARMARVKDAADYQRPLDSCPVFFPDRHNYLDAEKGEAEDDDYDVD